MSELPFTTIEPNKGVGYVRETCACKELKVKDNPKNSVCIEGVRFIPVNLLDVAGLVPDAHKGKGLGNRFLNDLGKADVLMHIVDATGALNKEGQRIAEGANDPYQDIEFLEREIDLWFKNIIEREDWDKFKRTIQKERAKFSEVLYQRLSGLKVKRSQINGVLKKLVLENKNPAEWDDNDLTNFSKNLRKVAKPIIVVANKIDKEIAHENYVNLKKKCSSKVIPCSALAERIIRKYEEEKKIQYIPGSNDFKIIRREAFTEKELDTLDKIKKRILEKYGGTGVQEAINYAVFTILNQICVYPVANINDFSDKSDNVLPDVFLIRKGMKLKEFVRKNIHSDLADHFIYGIDARSRRRLSESYELKNNDIIKIVSAK